MVDLMNVIELPAWLLQVPWGAIKGLMVVGLVGIEVQILRMCWRANGD